MALQGAHISRICASQCRPMRWEAIFVLHDIVFDMMCVPAWHHMATGAVKFKSSAMPRGDLGTTECNFQYGVRPDLAPHEPMISKMSDFCNAQKQTWQGLHYIMQMYVCCGSTGLYVLSAQATTCFCCFCAPFGRAFFVLYTMENQTFPSGRPLQSGMRV